MRSKEEVLAEIEKDSKIDSIELEHEMLNTPILMNKYMKWHFEYKVALAKGETAMNELKAKLYIHYVGAGESNDYRERPFNLEIKNSKDLEMFCKSDDRYCNLKEMIVEYEAVKDLLGTMIENLKYRNNTLASIIELRKFEAGV